MAGNTVTKAVAVGDAVFERDPVLNTCDRRVDVARLEVALADS